MATLPELFHGQGSALQPLAQRFAFQVFHDQEVGAILTTHIEKRADVRMMQGR